MGKAYLFKPTNVLSLLTDYPELKEIKEFRDLPARYMAFVNYYANPSSDFVAIRPENIKLEKCVKKAFDKSISPEEKAKFMAGDFPNSVVAAIDRMKNFNPSARLRSKAILNSVFDKLESMIDMKSDKIESIEDKKKYAELIIKIAESQQSLIGQLERGFGITEEQDEEMKSGPSMMEEAIEQEI